MHVTYWRSSNCRWWWGASDRHLHLLHGGGCRNQDRQTGGLLGLHQITLQLEDLKSAIQGKEGINSKPTESHSPEEISQYKPQGARTISTVILNLLPFQLKDLKEGNKMPG